MFGGASFGDVFNLPACWLKKKPQGIRKMEDWLMAHVLYPDYIYELFDFQSVAEAGIDILNPVQCSAAKMDPKTLKEKYGDKFVFWGGGVDTQYILPFGTPEEVKAQVKERIEIFSKDGGYVFNTIHNIVGKTPVENILAMLEVIKEMRG